MKIDQELIDRFLPDPAKKVQSKYDKIIELHRMVSDIDRAKKAIPPEGNSPNASSGTSEYTPTVKINSSLNGTNATLISNSKPNYFLIGGLLALVFVALFVLWKCRKKKKEDLERQASEKAENTGRSKPKLIRAITADDLMNTKFFKGSEQVAYISGTMIGLVIVLWCLKLALREVKEIHSIFQS